MRLTRELCGWVGGVGVVKYVKITQHTSASILRYALAIGGKSVWLVHIFTWLLYIVAKPIALMLDLALGEEMGTIHNKRQLVQLVRFHENAKVRPCLR